MWKNINRLSTIFNQSLLLTPEACVHQQLRTTFILKRRNQPMLSKRGEQPKRLKPKHYIYELVQDTDSIKKPNMEVILTSYVEGLGDIGQKVSVRPNFAYKNLLLPGLAVYATPENVDKYKDVDFSDQKTYSSPTAKRMVDILARMTLSVIMNKEIPWTLQPWHVKASFRKCGYVIPEDCITMPRKPIKGPNMDIENKEFFITVTINKKETVEVRCRIHHWSTSVTDRMPHVHEFWKTPTEPIFAEDAENRGDSNNDAKQTS